MGSHPGLGGQDDNNKKKYTVNDIIKDARKDTKHTNPLGPPPLMLN